MTPVAARRVIEPLIPRWRREGAVAVLLVGSHARGTAGDESDVDVAIVGDGPHYRLEVHDGVLVSVGWATADVQRARLYEPRYLSTHVTGWRDAVILDDPDGVAAAIVAETRAWSWDRVVDECDSWAAETVTSYAEEVLKLVAALRRGQDMLAAAERAILAIRLALPMAVRHRMLLTSENELWDRVAEGLGEEWSEAQRDALGLGGGDLRSSCRGALRLFELSASEVGSLLNENQRAVVDVALRASQPHLVESP